MEFQAMKDVQGKLYLYKIFIVLHPSVWVDNNMLQSKRWMLCSNSNSPQFACLRTRRADLKETQNPFLLLPMKVPSQLRRSPYSGKHQRLGVEASLAERDLAYT